jgi:PAS domain S-box-containing protein
MPALATGKVPQNAGWESLFWSAFTRSKNGMALSDDRRRHVEVNGAYLRLLGYRRAELIGHPLYELSIGGPVASEREWQDALRRDQFTGLADLRRQDGGRVTVEFAGHPCIVNGRRLVLIVLMSANRRGRRLSRAVVDSSRPAPLSHRELEIVRLIALGSSGPEIADELHLAHDTVRTHVRNAMTKVGARSRAQLVAMLLGDGVSRSSS